MNAIQALQLALSKPGTKVRPVGAGYSYESVGGLLRINIVFGKRLATTFDMSEVVDYDGTPVQWEEAE